MKKIKSFHRQVQSVIKTNTPDKIETIMTKKSFNGQDYCIKKKINNKLVTTEVFACWL